MPEVLRKRFRWRDEAGQVFVIFALALPVLLGASAIVVDVGNLFFQKRTLQGAADAAALAGSQVLSDAAALTGNYSGLNAGTATTGPLQNCTLNPNGDCYSLLSNDRVEVKLRKSVHTFFAGIFGLPNVTVSARAVAKASSGVVPQYTFVALNK